MYTAVFQYLGLAQNEAKIYETLLIEGESSVGDIAKKSKVHRRNVYDSLNRLIEKGLVFEIIQHRENRYQAVNPDKLMEIVQEKENMLSRVMPDLQKLYKNSPHQDEVYIYRGPEGWKNYMRDMLRVADEAHFIAAKGAWLDARVKNFFPQFIKETKKKNMKFHHLFDYEVQTECPKILPYIGKDYKFFPKGYSAPAAIDIFGNHVNILSGIKIGGFVEEFSFTVIVNQQIADAMRIWFRFMWDFCPDVSYNLGKNKFRRHKK